TPPPPDIPTPSLHDALPISAQKVSTPDLTAVRRARTPEGPNYGAAILFLFPAAILLVVFLLYPSLYTILLSFNRGRNGVFEQWRSEEHTSELQSRGHLVCRL